MAFLLEHETSIRLLFFFGIFFLMAFLESRSPRRQWLYPKTRRWSHNISLVFLNSILLRWLLPFSAVMLATMVQQWQWGVFSLLNWPLLVEVLVAVVLLDLAIYLQHVMFHAVPVFWRLHRVHHSDPDFDVTTGSRFHPIEIVLSMLIKFALILFLGPDPLAVILFEIVLNGMAMFNHSNFDLPQSWDGRLRRLVVTPDMHRVHHSREENEANSNFGFNLSVWDRLFGTYQAQPALGHQGMEIGIRRFDEQSIISLPRLLIQPWLTHDGGYAINRRWNPDRPSQSDKPPEDC